MFPQLLLFAVVLQSLISCCTGPFGRSAQSPVMFHRGGNRDMEKWTCPSPSREWVLKLVSGATSCWVHTLRAPRRGSTAQVRGAARVLSGVPHRRFHPPTGTAGQVSPQRLRCPFEILPVHSLQAPFSFYERIYLRRERVRDSSRS